MTDRWAKMELKTKVEEAYWEFHSWLASDSLRKPVPLIGNKILWGTPKWFLKNDWFSQIVAGHSGVQLSAGFFYLRLQLHLGSSWQSLFLKLPPRELILWCSALARIKRSKSLRRKYPLYRILSRKYLQRLHSRTYPTFVGPIFPDKIRLKRFPGRGMWTWIASKAPSSTKYDL